MAELDPAVQFDDRQLSPAFTTFLRHTLRLPSQLKIRGVSGSNDGSFELVLESDHPAFRWAASGEARRFRIRYAYLSLPLDKGAFLIDQGPGRFFASYKGAREIAWRDEHAAEVYVHLRQLGRSVSDATLEVTRCLHVDPYADEAR